jgi:cell division protein FtsW (lipid II flippase)
MSNPVATLGQPGPEQYGYIAGFKGREVEVYATGLFAASVAAEAFFKPSRKQRGLMWVVLCEKPDGEQVTHVITA